MYLDVFIDMLRILHKAVLTVRPTDCLVKITELTRLTGIINHYAKFEINRTILISQKSLLLE